MSIKQFIRMNDLRLVLPLVACNLHERTFGETLKYLTEFQISSNWPRFYSWVTTYGNKLWFLRKTQIVAILNFCFVFTVVWKLTQIWMELTLLWGWINTSLVFRQGDILLFSWIKLLSGPPLPHCQWTGWLLWLFFAFVALQTGSPLVCPLLPR